MARKTANARAILAACRKSDIIASLDRLCAENAEEQRRAGQRLHELERQADKRELEHGALLPEPAQGPALQAVSSACLREAEAQIELLNRKLAAAQLEIRKYQTRVFACEREILALYRENAELEALCSKARRCGITLEPEPAQEAVSAWEFAAEKNLPPKAALAVAGERPARPAVAVAERAETPRCVQAPGKLVKLPRASAPKTALERLAVQLLDQMDRLLRA